ncbi:MAG: hypothetical protein WBZ11_10745, partial [Candidatus Sulfotelmatobacter sp.]
MKPRGREIQFIFGRGFWREKIAEEVLYGSVSLGWPETELHNRNCGPFKQAPQYLEFNIPRKGAAA